MATLESAAASKRVKQRQKATIDELQTARSRQPRDIQRLAGDLQKLGEMADLGITLAVAASAISVNERTLTRWSRGESWPQTVTFERLDDLIAVIDHLRDTFTSVDAARTWLWSDNPRLGDLRPIDALLAGRLDRVEAGSLICTGSAALDTSPGCTYSLCMGRLFRWYVP
jgi:hypothetical protein